MKPRYRSWTGQLGNGARSLVAQVQLALSGQESPASAPSSLRGVALPARTDPPLEFHRRMFAIITAVQAGVWEKGVEQLVGYATDYGLGQARGVQTLVLKTRGRSAYVRLEWNVIMSDDEASRQQVASSVRAAIGELA